MDIPQSRSAPVLAGFPLPFSPLRTLSGGRDGPYIVAAMFTPDYASKAKRLIASCERFGLPYAVHEVPAVHCSISSRGVSNPAYTKANFIHHLLTEHRKPVVYVDADCEFMAAPELLGFLVQNRTDFAIYNWLADEHTDAFFPVELGIGNAPSGKNRFYSFSHRVEYYAHDQLFCSGAVQFYGNSDAARFLLAQWFHTIAAFPNVADDACLDFAYNNMIPPARGLRSYWLPKAYARYSWWIYAMPIINHADFPNMENRFIPIADPGGRQRFYPERCEKRNFVRLFPPDCIIDTQQRVICERVGNQIRIISHTDQNFWV